jgi:DeoR family ulaG and ulaABCDEF operon transcriptional repressor
MNEGDRHRTILDFLKDRPFASVRELQAVMDASPATIRRDISKLHAAGAVRKVFGGLSAAGPSEAERLSARPFEENQMIAVEAKKAIAAAAEKLVRDGDSLIVHGGSTCLLFALRLARRSVRILTNSMPLAAALGQHGTCHLTLSGGDLHRESGVLGSGGAPLPDFYASRFFIGAQAIAAGGAMESNPLIIHEAEKLLARADEVVVLADSSKFDLRARHRLMPLSRIGVLVTDAGLRDEDRAMLEAAGVRVILAEPAVETGEAAAPLRAAWGRP